MFEVRWTGPNGKRRLLGAPAAPAGDKLDDAWQLTPTGQLAWPDRQQAPERKQAR